MLSAIATRGEAGVTKPANKSERNKSLEKWLGNTRANKWVRISKTNGKSEMSEWVEATASIATTAANLLANGRLQGSNRVHSQINFLNSAKFKTQNLRHCTKKARENSHRHSCHKNEEHHYPPLLRSKIQHMMTMMTRKEPSRHRPYHPWREGGPAVCEDQNEIIWWGSSKSDAWDVLLKGE